MESLGKMIRLAGLTSEERLILALRYCGQLSESDIAAELNEVLGDDVFSREHVHARLRSSSRKLRRAFDQLQLEGAR